MISAIQTVGSKNKSKTTKHPRVPKIAKVKCLSWNANKLLARWITHLFRFLSKCYEVAKSLIERDEKASITYFPQHVCASFFTCYHSFSIATITCPTFENKHRDAYIHLRMSLPTYHCEKRENSSVSLCFSFCTRTYRYPIYTYDLDSRNSSVSQLLLLSAPHHHYHQRYRRFFTVQTTERTDG